MTLAKHPTLAKDLTLTQQLTIMQESTGTLLGNPPQTWLIAAGATLLTFVFLRYVAVLAARRLSGLASKTENYWDDVVASALRATKSWLLFFVSLSLGSRFLELPDGWAGVLESVAVIALLGQGGLWLSSGLSAWLTERSRLRSADDPGEVMTVNVIGIAVKIALWSIVLLLALENVGVDVTALIAGLGVGGIAVALAAQNILGDLFASLSIALDKPFVLGDFVIVGDFLGSVEAIGLKTTRIRSLSGEQVVFSNTDLLSSRIRNYGRMYERRVVLEIGVTYQTPLERLRDIPELIRSLVEDRAEGQDVRFDRAHMSALGSSAILFETVYYVLSPEYAVHMDIKQDIFLRLHEAFAERGVEFAYPTQTVFLERGESMGARTEDVGVGEGRTP